MGPKPYVVHYMSNMEPFVSHMLIPYISTLHSGLFEIMTFKPYVLSKPYAVHYFSNIVSSLYISTLESV